MLALALLSKVCNSLYIVYKRLYSICEHKYKNQKTVPSSCKLQLINNKRILIFCVYVLSCIKCPPPHTLTYRMILLSNLLYCTYIYKITQNIVVKFTSSHIVHDG